MITITPKSLSGKIIASPSKSLSHRYLIAASLAKGKSVITNLLDSDDLIATKEALSALGATFTSSNTIVGSSVRVTKDEIYAHESGSTLRFLIPLAMLDSKAVRFTGTKRLLERPQTVYQDIFSNSNCFFNHQIGKYIDVKGPLVGGEYYIKGDISSQFITGLLYALPLCSNDSKLVITTKLESKGYVDLTIDVLAKFGINIIRDNNSFIIPGNQSYRAGNFSVEGDYSNAAFFIVAALIGDNPITISNLNENSLQGDIDILNIVKQMGGKYQFDKDSLTVYPSKTKGITIDLAQIPDLGPILMVLAALSEGITTFNHISRLRIKESDRMAAIYDELSKMNVKIEINDDSAKIYGQKSLGGNVMINTHNDHRIAMALAIASIRADGDITFDDETVVSKSYPNFFSEYQNLGGLIK